ncbi:MAG: hypothetical protein JJV98_00870 [Desulfosarcina sp.]|nr:hypothetical protein [Desulfobacterales bacterium]
MTASIANRKMHWISGVLVMAGLMALPGNLAAQEEVASALRRYKAYEASSGYYEEYEVRPRHQRPLVGIPGVSAGLMPYSPSGASVRNRSRLADSHQGIRFYAGRRCEDCHVGETRDFHTVRAGLTCRQCHGGEPIASISHYYSPMNPIRRHAYVCAKCHEGASASYASYVIHAPNPASRLAQQDFPALFYAFWIMAGIAVLTFVVFLPHTALWGLREFFVRKENSQGEPKGEE